MKKIFSLLGGISIMALVAGSFTFAFTQEQKEAYEWAYKYGLTSQPTIEAARMNSPLTRQAFSKMIISYLENVVGVRQTASNACYFPDESKITNNLVPYTRKTCAYEILGINGENFNPTQLVDRAQLGTVFSRILWGDKHDVTGKGYYIYHVNALQDAGIMNNISNVKGVSAKRGDVLIMFKRMYEKYGSNVYLNNGNQSLANNGVKIVNTGYTTRNANTGNNISSGYVVKTGAVVRSGAIAQLSGNHEDSDNEYISEVYDNSNVIYTGKSGAKYYYDDVFLSMLKNAAEKKGESDLADYLEIESAYFKSGMDQLSNLDDEDMLKSMGIDIDNIDPNNMTYREKQDLIKNFKSAFDKIIGENKARNNKLVRDLSKVVKNINKDKFGLKEKYEKTKAFMEASNNFLDAYSESLYSLIELSLNQDKNSEEEGVKQALGVISAAMEYQGTAQEYQTYVEEWAVSTIKALGLN